MANLLTERQRGALPSNSEVNPRQEGNEHVKTITLRSGKELAAPRQPPVIGEVETKEVIQPSQTDKVVGEQPHQSLRVDHIGLNPLSQFRTLNT